MLVLLPMFGAFSVPCTQPKSQAADATPEVRVDASALSNVDEIGRHVSRFEATFCNGGYRWLDQPTTVEHFAGGRLKTIRVIHYAAPGGGKAPSPGEVGNKVLNVWQGKFRAAFCSLPWSEGTWWTSESTLEFEEGKRGTLITDGVHVFLRDRDGKPWFFRLYPAAQ
jgi:hypothetical protein